LRIEAARSHVDVSSFDLELMATRETPTPPAASKQREPIPVDAPKEATRIPSAPPRSGPAIMPATGFLAGDAPTDALERQWNAGRSPLRKIDRSAHRIGSVDRICP